MYRESKNNRDEWLYLGEKFLCFENSGMFRLQLENIWSKSVIFGPSNSKNNVHFWTPCSFPCRTPEEVPMDKVEEYEKLMQNPFWLPWCKMLMINGTAWKKNWELSYSSKEPKKCIWKKLIKSNFQRNGTFGLWKGKRSVFWRSCRVF